MPLMLAAAKAGRNELVELAAEYYAKLPDREPCWTALREPGTGSTCLHLAVECGDHRVVDAVLRSCTSALMSATDFRAVCNADGLTAEELAESLPNKAVRLMFRTA
jgi:hypothetical protein